MKRLSGTARATNTFRDRDMWNWQLWLKFLSEYVIFNPDPIDLVSVIGKN